MDQGEEETRTRAWWRTTYGAPQWLERRAHGIRAIGWIGLAFSMGMIALDLAQRGGGVSDIVGVTFVLLAVGTAFLAGMEHEARRRDRAQR
jgi:hypothetical protein